MPPSLTKSLAAELLLLYGKLNHSDHSVKGLLLENCDLPSLQSFQVLASGVSEICIVMEGDCIRKGDLDFGSLMLLSPTFILYAFLSLYIFLHCVPHSSTPSSPVDAIKELHT